MIQEKLLKKRIKSGSKNSDFKELKGEFDNKKLKISLTTK